MDRTAPICTSTALCGRFGFRTFVLICWTFAGFLLGRTLARPWSCNCPVPMQESALAQWIWHHSVAPITTRPLRGRNVVGACGVFGADRGSSPSPRRSLKHFCMFRWWVRILSVVVQLVRLPWWWSRSGCHLDWLEPLPIPAGPTKRTLFPYRRPALRHVLLSDAADFLSTWEKCRRCPEVPLPGASLARAAVVPLRSFRAIFGRTPS